MRRRTFLSLPALAAAAEKRPRKTARQLANDHQRPKYHLMPPGNWMNDPNGPIYWNGRYHMFYQYNPNGAFWGTMHWGHAVSADMIHWRHMPPALAPKPGGYDKDGVFSGCAVVKDGVPTIVYTATLPETQCVAFAEDNDLRSWRRAEKNPVIPRPPAGLESTGFRDPCVWQEDGTWYMALGSGRKGVGGMVLLYRSPDLLDWTYMHPLFEGKMDPSTGKTGPVGTGEMWECPSFFPLGDKHVLFVSTRDTTPYWIGKYKDFRFTPEHEGVLDSGTYYAPITQLDALGRRILWGWIQEGRTGDAAGWAGVMSLPRVMALRNDGRLNIEPAPQTRVLRGRRHEFANLPIPDGNAEPVPGVQGDALELIVTIDVGGADEVGLEVLGAQVIYSRSGRRVHVGSMRPEDANELMLGKDEPLRLHVFADCSVIEVIANGRSCVTGRVYPPAGSVQPVSLLARGGEAKLQSLLVFEMKAISPDRLATFV